MNDVKKNPKVDLYVTFGRDPAYYGTVGLAWTGGACKSGRGRNDDGSITPELWTGTSFNEWRKTASATAAVKIEYKYLIDVRIAIYKCNLIPILI